MQLYPWGMVGSDLKYTWLHPHLHQNSPAQFGFDQRFGHPAGGVGGGAVHL